MVTFDKTGTLTKGSFQVVDCQVGGSEQGELHKRWAGEQQSEAGSGYWLCSA